MNIFRFQDRAGILDERSQRFLMTVAWLSGYVSPEQAQERKQNISKLGQLSGEPALLPHRGSKLYLWQEIVLQRPSGELAVAMVDHLGARSRESLNTLTGSTRSGTPRFRPTVNHIVGCGDGICAYASS